MKTKVKKELIKLAYGELSSCILFGFCYFIWFKETKLQIVYPLFLLCFILLQGSIYWFICLIKLNRKNFNYKKIMKVFIFLKYINAIFLIGYIPIIILSPKISNMYYIGSIFLSIFALIEYINYFMVRLSYPKVGILINKIINKNLTKSNLAKDIQKLKTA